MRIVNALTKTRKIWKLSKFEITSRLQGNWQATPVQSFIKLPLQYN